MHSTIFPLGKRINRVNSFIMKVWSLSARQAVSYSHYRLSFGTQGEADDLVLRMEQFWNLHDILRSFTRRGHYPLGRGLWLRISIQGASIENRCVRFLFRGKSWRCYKKRIHWQIHSFLRHERVSTGYQLHARTPSRLPHRSRTPSPTSPPRQISSWPSQNAVGANVMRSQSTTVSERLYPNHGQRFSFKGAVDALRNRAPSTETLSSHSSTHDDIEEFSSCCTIE